MTRPTESTPNPLGRVQVGRQVDEEVAAVAVQPPLGSADRVQDERTAHGAVGAGQYAHVGEGVGAGGVGAGGAGHAAAGPHRPLHPHLGHTLEWGVCVME